MNVKRRRSMQTLAAAPAISAAEARTTARFFTPPNSPPFRRARRQAGRLLPKSPDRHHRLGPRPSHRPPSSATPDRASPAASTASAARPTKTTARIDKGCLGHLEHIGHPHGVSKFTKLTGSRQRRRRRSQDQRAKPLESEPLHQESLRGGYRRLGNLRLAETHHDHPRASFARLRTPAGLIRQGAV